ncbi:MAG: hypothetical protein IJ030_04530 [Oscillospiraceae bacterium]|nr:hypothetical protein [Oscillospiraceae bacterium]
MVNEGMSPSGIVIPCQCSHRCGNLKEYVEIAATGLRTNPAMGVVL